MLTSDPDITTTASPRLKDIKSPEDLRDLSVPQLKVISRDIRETIINTVSETGGHLAPSLGVVELTLALHKVFNTPEDKLIWDVGHQTYAHKLITGRQETFHTLRQYKGMSGFPKFKESPYDALETGHSSTSLSAALGMSCGKEMNGDKRKVIAVIGDGSMTAGMAFEALNQAGHLDRDLIVILNDNEMSISENVGALSSFLSRKLTGKTVSRLRNHIATRLHELSGVGENILSVLKRSEENIKSFFTPGMLFEALKFYYVGPIPGHDLDALLPTLENVRDNLDGPVLVHVITTKGKGYKPAEDNPGNYHGVGPFEIKTGSPHPSGGPVSYTRIFGETMSKMARKNPKIIGISAAMPAGTGLDSFAEEFPERFFDVGIAEQHAVTFAAGLALEGFHPMVAIYSSFFQRAMDQIIHDVCLQNLPVTLAIDRGGVVGDDGPTHHGVFDISFLRYIPNLVYMAPKDEDELQHMLFTASRFKGPSAVRYPRGSGEGVKLESTLKELTIGQGEVLREGSDLLLLPVGNRVHPALRAAEGLSKLGIAAAVINPRFIKPLDADLICDWAEHTGRMITIEDNAGQGGFGSSILELFSQRGLYGIKSKILAHPDHFIEHGPQKTLWRKSSLDSPSIIKVAIELMKAD
ncbi:MAG: 1-deoxy-D-xylulose-5-phosphate synthase [Desulfobulbaceae bacterium]|uniref:1-deoxy-D-xylulose-5-phosphate synthase n=1 Tax=Candidatus Desulfatifera sulfidica TaxID=2841691 RepID=A0A8J6TAB0_9BACT|nr:1-deoxy-D-xylulose-5-phosphate synthase [Candidatus Desulfatifera sulfidica]